METCVSVAVKGMIVAGVIFECPSTVFIKAGCLNQTQSSRMCLT